MKWWPCLLALACRAPEPATPPAREVRAVAADAAPPDAAVPPDAPTGLALWGVEATIPDERDTRMVDDRYFFVSFGGIDDLVIQRRDEPAPATADELAASLDLEWWIDERARGTTEHGASFVVRRTVRYEGMDSHDGEIIHFRAEALEVYAALALDSSQHVSCRGKVHDDDTSAERALDAMVAICKSLRRR